MRAFNRDELRKFGDEKRCPTCDNENYFDHAEIFEIYQKKKYTDYSRCLMCDATYKHRVVKFSYDIFRSFRHYHITKQTFLKNRKKSTKHLVDRF